MDTLKINEHHQSMICAYVQLNRYQRQQYLRSVESTIVNIVRFKIIEDTYTRDEVNEIFINLQRILLDDLEAELINVLQANVLMLRQLFLQAEKWHLQMNVDLSEIQNKKLLDEIKNIENIIVKMDKSKLTPLYTNADKSYELLRLEILNLQKENNQLCCDLKKLQEKILNDSSESENLLVKCNEKDKIIEELQKTVTENQTQTNIVPSEISLESEKILTEYEDVLKEQIANELDVLKNKVNQTQSQLILAESELEKKFNDTTAFNNMKKIIQKKNEQIKELRNRLSQYESLDDETVSCTH